MKLFCDNCMGENEVAEEILDKQGFRSECHVCGHMIFLDSETIEAIMLRKKQKRSESEIRKPADSPELDISKDQQEDSAIDDLTTTLSAEMELPRTSTSPAEFIVVEGRDSGLVVSMDTDRLVFGRRGADINLNDRLISRRHAAIESGGGRYLLKDLGSTNGTFLNGYPANMEFLKHGDEIQMGSTLIRFRITGMESDVIVFH